MPSHKKRFEPIQKANLVLTFTLLFLEFSNPLIEWFWGITSQPHNTIPLWFKFFFLFFEYILVTTAIWLNRNNLIKLNIDKPFVIVFAFTGVIISLYYLPNPLSAVVVLITLIILGGVVKNRFRFNKSDTTYSQTMWFFAFGLLPVIALFLLKCHLMENGHHMKQSGPHYIMLTCPL